MLTTVDLAKDERRIITTAAARIAALDDTGGMAEARALAQTVLASAERIDGSLTDIMLAQDFHDLTGQVVARVAALAIELEDSLVKLLVQAAPAELRTRLDSNGLQGPTIEIADADTVAGQSEVDELLASLGF